MLRWVLEAFSLGRPPRGSRDGVSRRWGWRLLLLRGAACSLGVASVGGGTPCASVGHRSILRGILGFVGDACLGRGVHNTSRNVRLKLPCLCRLSQDRHAGRKRRG